jgi:glycerophosphoryl diester phosphodiesterase
MRDTSAVLSLLMLLYAGCAPAAVSRDPGQGERLSGNEANGYAAQTMSTKTPMIIAHRGLHHDLPENSKEAMLAGWKAGVEWCECDVYLSTDGVAFMMHDAKLDRTTQAKGPLAGRSSAELRTIRLKNPDGTLSECTVPTLEEVLAVMPAGRGLLIEVKPADDEKLVREVLRVSKGKRVVIQSFDEADVRHSLRLAKQVRAAMLVGKPERLDAGLAGDWPEINIDFKLLDEEVIRRARDAGMSLGVWTVDEPADIRRALDAGVARIITNFPERVRAAMP